jgi:50S ribosomal protein L16 3-hydroxylase
MLRYLLSLSRNKLATVPFDLPTLLNADDAGGFFSRAWPDRLFVAHGPRARLGRLLALAPLKSGDAFVRAWKGTATVWPRRGKPDALLAAPGRTLGSYYGRGFTLYFSKVEEVHAGVVPFLRRLERDLGLRRGDMTCEAIVSRKGAGAAAHFDADGTFNVQLEGRKRWRVAPNDSVDAPHKAGMIGDPIHAEMAGYARQPFPERLPPDATMFDTKPGSVVFLPHGCWHETECLTDSLAIAFVVPGPKWYQLFAEEVAQELAKHPAARQLSLMGPRANRETAAEVLTALRAIANDMDVERLFKRWNGPPALLFRKRSSEREGFSRASSELGPLLRWVKGAPAVFSSHEAMDAFPGAESSAILRGLFALVAAGVLELG